MNRLIHILFCLCFCAVSLTSGSIVRAEENGGAFPEIKGKFPSNSQSCTMNGEMVDYCGLVQVVFDRGTLYRRRDKISYDFYFEGEGRINILDTSRLETNWRQSFGDKRTLEFSQGYICDNNIPDYMMLEADRWKDDKIKREQWQKLQFMVKAPERYFWVNMSGELGIRPDRGKYSPPVWMQLELTDGKNIIFYIAPDHDEQLNIFESDLDFRQPYLLVAFRVNTCLNIPAVEIDSMVLAVMLKDYGKFEAADTIYFPAGSSLRGMNFSLPAWLIVDSVLDAFGHRLDFIKKKERNYFYLSPRPDPGAGPDRIAVFYRGKFLKPQFQGYDLPAHLTTWFPQLPRRNLGYYTLKYTFHKDLDLISPGEKSEEYIAGDYKTVTYTTRDISYASFAYGLYDTLHDTVSDIPFTFYIRRENTRGLFGGGVPKRFETGLKDAFEAFYDWYGPPVAQSIRVVDQPRFLAQSSPGLIHMTLVTDLPTRYQPRIRSHEIAHQWWGHTVVPATYRDVWLSEGIAEYSSALFILKILNDTADYHDRINEWRRDVIQEGRIGGKYSRGYKAGPIITGVNFFLSHSPGDYWALIYSKAAYMLEMLRFEIDGPEFRNDFFNAMLAEYRRTFFEKQATSLDFIRVAANYIGERRAAIFFKQWLFDWRVPEFEARYWIKPDKKGRPILEMEIEASGVEPGFETPFPVEIEFDDGSRRLFRLDGIGQRKDHMLGPFPGKIKKVRFDPDHIILNRGIKVTGSE